MTRTMPILTLVCSVIAACLLFTSPALAGGCEGDANSDGRTDVLDLLTVLDDYGCEGEDCTGDLDGDDVVDVQDLLIVLGDFGCGFEECESHADCDDGDPCTLDFCTSFGCIHIPIWGCE
jgi:hypothetical protein